MIIKLLLGLAANWGFSIFRCSRMFMELRFLKAQAGNAVVEFALAMPILMLLALGGFEMTRFIIINQKISKTSSTMADLVARSPSLNSADITNIYNAVSHLMEPYPTGSMSRVIISNVGNNGTVTRVNWQRFGGGSFVQTSKIGTAGNSPSLPAGFTLGTNEDTIIAEVFYDYTPLVAPNIVARRTLYMAKFAKPRLGSLTVINP